MFKYLLFLNIIIFVSPLPVAIFHGFYDSCKNSYFPSLVNLIKYNLGDYSTCIETGGGSDSLSLSFQQQAEKACEEINKNEKFNGDFSILSISQGGLLARYIIQKCEMKGKVKKLVSFGGPMMGTSKVPFCLEGVVCYIINSLVDYFVYGKNIQKTVGPAGYYRTASHIGEYQNSDSFLLKLNNEGRYYDEKSKERFMELDSLMLIGFKNDKMISPKETAEFCEYDENFKLVPMNMTNAYINDSFGLKSLNEKKAIHVHYLEGEHIEFDFDDVLKYAIPYL
jgi:palmitoyl-protein thioesterase